jgi:hypothetical protein
MELIILAEVQNDITAVPLLIHPSDSDALGAQILVCP